MEKYFLNLTQIEFEEMDASLDAICEENEKFPANALFFLTNALKCSYNLIALSSEVIRTKKFPKDTNCICGINMHYDLSREILRRELLSDKKKELTQIEPLLLRADKYWDKLAEKDVNAVIPSLKIQEILYKITQSMILEIIAEQGITDKLKNIDKNKQFEVARFYLNTGRYSNATVQFFLDTFIYNKFDRVA